MYPNAIRIPGVESLHDENGVLNPKLFGVVSSLGWYPLCGRSRFVFFSRSLSLIAELQQ